MKLIFTPYIYILVFFYSFTPLQGQELKLTIGSKKDTNKLYVNKLRYSEKHPDKASLRRETDIILKKLETKGFLNAALDTIFVHDTIYKAQFILGDQTKYIRINYKNIPQQIATKGLLSRISSNITSNYFEIPFHEIQNTMKYFVEILENSGHSFVQVSLTNIALENERATALMQFTISKPRTIDKVITKGYADFPKKFTEHELQLKIGSTFNSTKLARASTSVGKIAFVEEQKPPETLFTKDSTFIYLYLKKKPSNKLDGIVGFSSNENKSGFTFNGYLDLSLQNIFNAGEKIVLFWKNNGNDSQRFFIGTELPFIFNLPISPKINFELFRKDSTFSNTLTQIDLHYSLKNKGAVSALIYTENSNQLSTNTNQNIASFNSLFYGLNYTFEKPENDHLFPTKYKIDLSAYFGQRKTEASKIKQNKWQLTTNYQWKIDTKNYLFLQNQSAVLHSNNYFENELFRTGGIDNIRGVNEESIFATAYSIFNVEYRFRPASMNYFYTISDFAYIANSLVTEKYHLFSFGIGYAFTNKLGLFNLSYTVAKFENQPFLWNNAMFHLKITNLF